MYDNTKWEEKKGSRDKASYDEAKESAERELARTRHERDLLPLAQNLSRSVRAELTKALQDMDALSNYGADFRLILLERVRERFNVQCDLHFRAMAEQVRRLK